MVVEGRVVESGVVGHFGGESCVYCRSCDVKLWDWDLFFGDD